MNRNELLNFINEQLDDINVGEETTVRATICFSCEGDDGLHILTPGYKDFEEGINHVFPVFADLVTFD